MEYGKLFVKYRFVPSNQNIECVEEGSTQWILVVSQN